MRLDSALSDPCRPPVTLPDHALSAGEALQVAASDRESLGACRDKHGAVVRLYNQLVKGLSGK